MDSTDVERLTTQGESETLEFKKSGAELARAGQALCGFLNGSGGIALIGVTPAGQIVGQEVSDSTQQDIATMLRRFEPPAPVHLSFIVLSAANRKVIVLEATPTRESLPFTYDGRPYERLGTATSLMPQERYRQLLFERTHSQSRWENMPAANLEIEALDRESILRTVRDGAAAGRLPLSTAETPTARAPRPTGAESCRTTAKRGRRAFRHPLSPRLSAVPDSNGPIQRSG